MHPNQMAQTERIKSCLCRRMHSHGLLVRPFCHNRLDRCPRRQPHPLAVVVLAEAIAVTQAPIVTANQSRWHCHRVRHVPNHSNWKWTLPWTPWWARSRIVPWWTLFNDYRKVPSSPFLLTFWKSLRARSSITMLHLTIRSRSTPPKKWQDPILLAKHF